MRLVRHLDLPPLRREERDQLNEGDFRLGDWGPQLLPLVRASLKRAWLHFQVVTPADLGHEHGAEWDVIWKSASQAGLGLVPKKLVLPLRLMYRGDEHDFVRIVHAPILGPGGRLYRFCLHNDGRYLWLRGRETGGDAAFWPGDIRFLFMRDHGGID